jgi:hypothetical protein
MPHRALVVVLFLATLGAPSSPGAARSLAPNESWQRTDSRRFEIHYLPGLARELERVTRSAERAYDRISGRLNFTLATKVPLVMFAASEGLTREQVVTYSMSDDVAPPQPHRSRIVLPLPQTDAQLDPFLVHELTHLLVFEMILPHASGDGGLPRWVREGIASYMAGGWSDEYERLMRDLVKAGDIPALSRLTGDGAFANPRLNDALGHVAFDYMESRWGPTSTRRFVDALIVPRVDKTYDAVFGLTPEEFDAAFQQYAARRFKVVR